MPLAQMMHEDLATVHAERRHVVLLTDGHVTLTTVGLGASADREFLRLMADLGRGRTYAVPEASALSQIFSREVEIVLRGTGDEQVAAHLATPASWVRATDLEGAPSLVDYVTLGERPSPAEVLLRAPNDDPLLARWRVGRGWVVTWSADLEGPQAARWIAWAGYGAFWGRLVREHARAPR